MTQSNSPARPTSRRNHYVPEWYQLGFQVGGSDNWLLEIGTRKSRPDGTPIVLKPYQRPVKASFWEDELYVTRFGELVNDEVETVVFQEIDNRGADAVRAFIDGDEVAMHHELSPLFAYLGAQKLRTPKGLAWIRARYPALSQVELLIELQHLRDMFGALWAESVREIVTAESADVKFIVSDHPVTMFNAGLPLDAQHFAFPFDPQLTWNGTQTLFALDANHLLILSHVPYAQNPAAVEAPAKRINARYFGNAMMRTDVLIRSRQFSSDDVIAVNCWLKARAARYIAAADREWLYPEARRPLNVPALAELLRPPVDQLWRYGGETYIGYKDGSTRYRDQFGRTSREHEAVAREAPNTQPASNDDCPCGSGHTYGSCCEVRAIWDRPSWNVLSMRERNERFLNALVNVLEVTPESSWTDVQRNLTDEQVARIHRLSQWLWPEDTDLAALLPRPREGRVSAVYMGISDPRLLGENVIALAPLFDQVLVMDPFTFGRAVKPEFSPIENPHEHKQQLLKNVLFWLSLQPLIDAGKVLVFPDPGNINADLRHAMLATARARSDGFELTEEHYEQMRWLAQQDAERGIRRLLLSRFREDHPDMPEAEADEVIETLWRHYESDPLFLSQPATEGNTGQFQIMSGMNLELALFIAQISGSAIVTDIYAMWAQIHAHTRAGIAPSRERSAAGSLHFTSTVHPAVAADASETAQARAIQTAVGALIFAADQGTTADDLSRLLASAQSQLDTLGEAIDEIYSDAPRVTVRLTASIPENGFESPTAQRLIVGFGSENARVRASVAFLRENDEEAPDRT